jgi:hypothetical protein
MLLAPLRRVPLQAGIRFGLVPDGLTGTAILHASIACRLLQYMRHSPYWFHYFSRVEDCRVLA